MQSMTRKQILASPDYPAMRPMLVAQMVSSGISQDAAEAEWPKPDAPAAPSEPDLLTQAIEALRLYDAFIATPVDRGGQKGPNGQAFKKFVDAKNAVLAAYDARGGA